MYSDSIYRYIFYTNLRNYKVSNMDIYIMDQHLLIWVFRFFKAKRIMQCKELLKTFLLLENKNNLERG